MRGAGEEEAVGGEREALRRDWNGPGWWGNATCEKEDERCRIGLRWICRWLWDREAEMCGHGDQGRRRRRGQCRRCRAFCVSRELRRLSRACGLGRIR